MNWLIDWPICSVNDGLIAWWIGKWLLGRRSDVLPGGRAGVCVPQPRGGRAGHAGRAPPGPLRHLQRVRAGLLLGQVWVQGHRAGLALPQGPAPPHALLPLPQHAGLPLPGRAQCLRRPLPRESRYRRSAIAFWLRRLVRVFWIAFSISRRHFTMLYRLKNHP